MKPSRRAYAGILGLLVIALLNPAAGRAQTVRQEPPRANIQTDAGRQQGRFGSYCWDGFCADSGYVFARNYLRVYARQPIEFQIAFDAAPAKVSATVREPLPEDANLDEVRAGPFVGRFRLRAVLEQEKVFPLEPGKYVVGFGAIWPNRDDSASWTFGIEVVDAPLPRTGTRGAWPALGVLLIVTSVALLRELNRHPTRN